MFYLIILLLMILLAVISRRGSPAAEKKDIWTAMAECLYHWLPGTVLQGQKTKLQLVRLYPGSQKKAKRTDFLIRRIRSILLILTAADILALFLWIMGGQKQTLADGSTLPRAGNAGREITLIAQTDDGERLEMKLVLQKREYTEKELEAMYEEMLPAALATALGENEGWEKITRRLCFPGTVAPYPFVLSWYSSDYRFLNASGEIPTADDVKEWKEKEALVEITLSAEYGRFQREYIFLARICPEETPLSFAEEVSLALADAQEKSAEKEAVILPKEVAGREIVWKEKTGRNDRIIFLIGLAAAAAVWLLQGRELETELEKRNRSLAESYLGIISKFTLYLGAGMNLKSAFCKIAAEGDDALPVYQEMKLSCREMEGGMHEQEAYEKFGKRIHQQRYIRLTTLLVQNLKKGNATLFSLLRQEAYAAIGEQSAAAKRKGEEAGTKLLLPMMLMLAMVMVFIMVPAFLSM